MTGVFILDVYWCTPESLRNREAANMIGAAIQTAVKTFSDSHSLTTVEQEKAPN